MFQLFKSKEDTIKELEAQIDLNKYQLVQGKNGKWAYKEWCCNEWLLHTMIKGESDKLKVIKWILEQQQEDTEREKDKANFS